MKIELKLKSLHNYVSSLYTELGTYCFTSVGSLCLSLCLSPIYFSPVLSIMQADKHVTLAQWLANVCLRADPTLAQYWVTVSCLAPL